MMNGETVKRVLSFKTPALNGAFTDKYITLQIFDESGSWFAIPVTNKYIHGDEVFVKINNRILALKIDTNYLKTYRHKASRPIQTLLYSTRDYNPIDLSDMKKLSDYSDQNEIKRLGPAQGMILQVAAMMDDEEDDRQAIPITEVAEKYISQNLDEQAADFEMQKAQVWNVIRDMGAKHLLKPVSPVSKILDRNMTNDPEYIASGYQAALRVNKEFNKIAHPAAGPFAHWLLVFVMIGLIAAALGGLAFYYSGGFDSVGVTVEDVIKASQEFGTQEEFLAAQNPNNSQTLADEVRGLGSQSAERLIEQQTTQTTTGQSQNFQNPITDPIGTINRFIDPNSPTRTPDTSADIPAGDDNVPAGTTDNMSDESDQAAEMELIQRPFAHSQNMTENILNFESSFVETEPYQGSVYYLPTDQKPIKPPEILINSYPDGSIRCFEAGSEIEVSCNRGDYLAALNAGIIEQNQAVRDRQLEYQAEINEREN